jgi:pyruvate dehydrogenase E2 component (dihydrolipoamide acetyltransferase)
MASSMAEVRVPEIGENVQSGEVVKVLVSEGDLVSLEQPIAELETDKAVVELPSPVAGRVARVLMQAGDTVTIGQVVMHVETSETKASAPSPAPQTQPPAPGATRPSVEQTASPERTDQAPIPPKDLPPIARGGSEVAASPAVRRLARELGVDLGRVTGSGTGGRISPEDVKEFVRRTLAQPQLQAPPQPPPGRAGGTLPDFGRLGPVTREPLSKVRRLTAENMTTSWTTIPQVTQYDQADITELEAFRRNAAARVEAQGGKLTVTAILTKVCAAALGAFPRFNSSLDWPAHELVLKQYCHIGIAVDTERGLIVPVVRDADRKSLTQLAVEIGDLATRTRDKKVLPDELEGGNFTISNLGGIGGTAFSPIVYAPQVAILGVARTRPELRLQHGHVAERLVLPLSLSYDHRVIDGAEGARFLRWIVEALENPYLAVLGA